MAGVPNNTNSEWGYKFHKTCPVDELKRNKIAKLMKSKGYNTNELEFRETGIRYAYWKPIDCIKDVNNIYPINEQEFDDEDTGDLWYYTWMNEN